MYFSLEDEYTDDMKSNDCSEFITLQCKITPWTLRLIRMSDCKAQIFN